MRVRLPSLVVAAFVLLVAHSAWAIGSNAILAHAKAFADHSWTATSANKTAWCSGGYTSDYGPGTYVGVAYDWGGFDSLVQYDQKLADGYGAGSHSWHGVLSCTTGLDCSGYVSRCWELTGKKGTATIHTVSHEIAKADVLPGDAYNKSGSHIVLWYDYAADGGPIFYEASGSASKVRLNTAATWGYLSGYKSIRYDGFDAEPVEMMSDGTIDNPIWINSFPFHHEANTKLSTSKVFDAYSCAPGTGEAGPEIVYRFKLAVGGKLTATVSDGTGVDIDVHLLSSASAASCIDRDDITVTAQLAAGEYWLSLDSWTDSGGIIYAGPYTLDVTFLPDAVQPPPDITGTLQKPFIVDSFPFQHHGDTSASVAVFSSYSCDPSKGEAGPEVVYWMNLGAQGTITATVADAEGVDIDLHLLSDPASSACVVRGDIGIQATVNPGIYWLIADSWSDGQGGVFPGQYDLTIGYAPAEDCEPYCQGAQCGYDGCWGSCGLCPPGNACQSAACVLSPACGDGACDAAGGEDCSACPADCPCGCGQTCVGSVCVLSPCRGIECGPDGCGGDCGGCSGNSICAEGQCVDTDVEVVDPREQRGEGDPYRGQLDRGEGEPGDWNEGGHTVGGSGFTDSKETTGCATGSGGPGAAVLLLLPLLLLAVRRRCR